MHAGRGAAPVVYSRRVAQTASAGLLAFVRNRPVLSFFVLAYALSWLLWTPMLFAGIPPFSAVTHTPSLYLLPGIALGVTGSAFVMTALTQGRQGVRRLVQRLLWWRVGIVWFAVAIALIPLLEIATALALGEPGVLRALTPGALALYPAAYLSHFYFGPLFEETGWRGFALPRLQHRYGPVRASLLLGVLWSAWHFLLYVPVWFSAGAVNGVIGIAVFVVTTTAMTFVFTWVSNNAKGSLLLMILLHGSVDGTATYLQDLADRGIIPAAGAELAVQYGPLVGCLLATIVLIAATRGRLGYPRYRQEAEPADLDGTVLR